MTNNTTTSEILSKKLSNLGAENILNCIKLIEKGEAKFTKQINEKAIYAKKISKLEAKIDWDQSAEIIVSKINALNPTPGAWFELNGSRHKIWKSEISMLSGDPGKILDESLVIGCGKKSIKILEIQKEGKKKLSIKNFLIGSKFTKNSKIS